MHFFHGKHGIPPRFGYPELDLHRPQGAVDRSPSRAGLHGASGSTGPRDAGGGTTGESTEHRCPKFPLVDEWRGLLTSLTVTDDRWYTVYPTGPSLFPKGHYWYILLVHSVLSGKITYKGSLEDDFLVEQRRWSSQQFQ